MTTCLTKHDLIYCKLSLWGSCLASLNKRLNLLNSSKLNLTHINKSDHVKVVVSIIITSCIIKKEGDMANLKILTLNCQGLGDAEKRKDVLNYLKLKNS